MPDPRSNDPTIPPSQVPTGSAPGLAPRTLAHLAPGTVISRYRIESVLGEGGMGTVYLARQEKPDREVALKVVRPGYATDKMLRRFEHESEVLGRLFHPGIAQIYEAGVFTSPERERAGLPPTPFFAMELVKGPSLTEYARQHNLSTRQRLELLAKVCDAVQHAHQKGVIHRDLKPGNILVVDESSSSSHSVTPSLRHSVTSSSAQPKILDFGVARATDSDIQSTTMETDIGALVGTIPYMSPEQVGGNPDDLDTRSDVYALGVIAYELLVGRLPYDLERKMIHEAARIIREDEPTRLSSIDRTLRGDIETIVAHALEKDKSRRYTAASALAADIRRHLSDEPIAARPASTWYQVQKFSRRNKGLVTGIAAAFAILLAGIAATGWALQRALIAESGLSVQLEETKKANAAATAARDAEKERADQLKKVSDFQAQMLSQIDTTKAGVDLMADIRERFVAALEKSGVSEPDRAARGDAILKELVRVNATDTAASMIDRTILKPAIKAIDEQFKDDPRTDASLRQALADLYRTIGLYDAAFPLQRQALDTRRRVLGEVHPDTLTSINNMGFLLQDQGKLDQAEPFVREALEKFRRVLGEEHPDTLTAINNIGLLLHDQGKLAEAEPYVREALEKRRRVLGEEHPDTLNSINNMGGLLQEQGKLDEAELYYREALEKFRRVLGEEHPDTLTALAWMGSLLQGQGKLAEAEPYVREAMEKSRRVLGENHPETINSINNMGGLLRAQGKLSEAESYCREALEKRRRVVGEEHPDTLSSINNVGTMLRQQNKLAEAEPYLREATEKFRRVLGEDHSETIKCINNMGELLQAQGKLDQAETCYREALEKSRRVLGEKHPDTLVSMNNMGVLLLVKGKLSEAETLLLPSAAIAEATLPPRHQCRVALARSIAGLYTTWNAADPGKGYDVKAGAWKAKLDALNSPPVPAPEQSPRPGG